MSRLLQVVRDGARRLQTGTEGNRPFQVETVGASWLQAGMEGVGRCRLRRREHSVSRPRLRKLCFSRVRKGEVGPDPAFMEEARRLQAWTREFDGSNLRCELGVVDVSFRPISPSLVLCL